MTEDCYKGRCRKERERIIAKRQARLAEHATSTRVEIEAAVADAVYAAYERGRRHRRERVRPMSWADTFRTFGEPLLKRLDGRE